MLQGRRFEVLLNNMYRVQYFDSKISGLNFLFENEHRVFIVFFEIEDSSQKTKFLFPLIPCLTPLVYPRVRKVHCFVFSQANPIFYVITDRKIPISLDYSAVDPIIACGHETRNYRRLVISKLNIDHYRENLWV